VHVEQSPGLGRGFCLLRAKTKQLQRCALVPAPQAGGAGVSAAGLVAGAVDETGACFTGPLGDDDAPGEAAPASG
jgi:hypothetical protein